MQQTLDGWEAGEDKDEEVLVSRGKFWAQDIRPMVAQDHKIKMRGIARHLLNMPTKLERRRWLDKFQAKHGQVMTDELKDTILMLHAARK